jgi:hypothetical protein
VEESQAWLPEQRFTPLLRVPILTTLSLLAGVSVAHTVMIVVTTPEQPAAFPIIILALTPAAVCAVVAPMYVKSGSRGRLARLLIGLALMGLWLFSVFSVAMAALGAVFVAALGYAPIAQMIGADRSDIAVISGLVFMTAYLTAAFLVLSNALRLVSSGSGLVTETSGAFVPGYALLVSIVLFASGAVAALSSIGAPAVSVIITLVLFGVGGLGRLIHTARRDLAAGRTELVAAIDALQIALDHVDVTAIRTAGLHVSRSASKKQAFGIRLLAAPVRECIDALVSHITAVPLPHAKPLDALANGKYRGLTVENSRELLHEGCTTIRMQLVES